MRVKQVLLNIQSNALKFTEVGSVTINVEITEEGNNQYLKVSVADTGMGIKDENKAKLF